MLLAHSKTDKHKKNFNAGKSHMKINTFFTICDSYILKKLDRKRTKLSYIIQDGIAYHKKLSFDDICHKQKFSIIIDESTNISVIQVLDIVVRYFDHNKLDVDALLSMVVVENGTANGLINSVESLFAERNIPLSNVISQGSSTGRPRSKSGPFKY